MTNNESTNDTAEQPVTPADMPQQQAEPTGEQPAEQVAEQVAEQAADEHTTFSREYVEELRGEAAKYRTRAKHTEEVERRLHDALVRLDGRLHDASDLDFDPKRLEGDGVEAAITTLLEAKPHLAKRAPSGDVGAGVRGEVDVAPDLISIMRGM